MSGAAPAAATGSTPDDRTRAVPRSTRVANLSHFLTRNAARLPDHLALAWGDARWTWRELDARVHALAAGLRDGHGVGPGDRVVVISRNSNQLLETMLATFRVGAASVPVSFRQRPAELAELARACDAALVVAGSGFEAHAAACAGVAHLTADGGGDDVDALVAAHLGAVVEDAPVDRDDPCWLLHTSGSTGRPKLVVLTHGQMTFVLLNHLHDLVPGTGPADRSLCVAPLSHGAGLHALVMLAAGAATVLLPAGPFDPDEAWRLVAEHGVTNLFAVPTIVRRLVASAGVDEHDHGSLRHLVYAGAPMYRSDQRAALQALGPVLVQYYGLGEVTGAITVLPRDEHHVDDDRMRVGTCGHVRSGMQVTVQDADGRVLAPGETGEVCVVGPAVFAGYLDDPAADAAAFRDGWFRTGDLGHLDDDGYLYLTGRASDMYISGGSNIHPLEVEEQLLRHPDVAEVAVLGVPDPTWGEAGVAACVARDGAALDVDELRAFLRERLAGHKVPRRFHVLDALPRSAYGKVTKALVRAELRDRGLLTEPDAT